jgi:hypothetical protein
MVVSVWRLVNTIFWCVAVLAYAWCHFELNAHSTLNTTSNWCRAAPIVDRIFYIAELS